jgi:hypothetical protein
LLPAGWLPTVDSTSSRLLDHKYTMFGQERGLSSSQTTQVRNLETAGAVRSSILSALTVAALAGVHTSIETTEVYGGSAGTCFVSMLKNLSARSSA